MDLNQLEKEIRDEIESRNYHYNAHADWYTPNGNRRSFPMYEVVIKNEYLNIQKTIKSKCEKELTDKSAKQLQKWADQEIKERLQAAKNDKEEKIKLDNEILKNERFELSNILNATLSVNDRINWEEIKDKSKFPEFHFNKEQPIKPVEPKPTFFQKLFPFLFKGKLEKYHIHLNKWKTESNNWENEKKEAQEKYKVEELTFYKNQNAHNVGVDKFKERFESGEESAIIEYINSVFERSEYPESFYVEYLPSYDVDSKTLVVDLNLPIQEKISKVKEYKYQKSSDTVKEYFLKDKEYDLIYDQAIKQCVLRTAHEIFESIYTDHVEAVVINAWIDYIDRATGADKVSCIVSLSANKEEFDKIKLDRIEVDACIKSLKGLTAGPLSELAPVKPIMQLNRKDKRFVESRDQLAELNSTINLAEMHWEDFEHLVRELFSKMFSTEGTEVKVTQSSSDGGIDAIAFDPDPIRGGKFVIQAKRYTKTVGVSAVRDLYGTMISEGAVKGILVSTATYGRDSREFVKDKPISLIDGSNLVYLLEQYGHKVRIDIKEARAKMKSVS